MTPHDSKPMHILALGGIDHTYRALTEMGAQYSLLQSKSLVTDYQIKTARELLLTDYEDVDLMIEYARCIHRKHPIDRVLSLSEYPQLAAAKIALALGVPTNCELFAVETTRDKHAFRRLLAEHGLPNLPFALVASLDELRGFYRSAGCAIVVKPVSGAGSEGVRFVGNDSELAAAFEHASGVRRGGVLAEKYVDGQEYSIESMSRDGKHEIAAITRKTVGGLPYFVEMGHVQPSSVGQHQAQLEDIIERMLSALGHIHGPAHTEIKINHEGIHIIESQVRLGGDQIWEMTMLTSGVDVAKETLCALMDVARPARLAQYPSAAIRYFAMPATAMSKDDILAASTRHQQVIRAHIDHANAGKAVAVHSGERAGYVLVHAENAEAAEQLAGAEVERLLEPLAAAA